MTTSADATAPSNPKEEEEVGANADDAEAVRPGEAQDEALTEEALAEAAAAAVPLESLEPAQLLARLRESVAYLRTAHGYSLLNGCTLDELGWTTAAAADDDDDDDDDDACRGGEEDGMDHEREGPRPGSDIPSVDEEVAQLLDGE